MRLAAVHLALERLAQQFNAINYDCRGLSLGGTPRRNTMKPSLLLGLIALLFLAGCSRQLRRSIPPPDLERRAVVVNGVEREYLLRTPPTERGPLPLLILFHGGRGNPARMARTTGLDAGTTRGFAVAFPAALGGNWNDGRPGTDLQERDDIAFAAALVDDVAEVVPLRRAAVFVAGISNGGMMAQRVACESPGIIRGVASVAANLPLGQADTCHPTAETVVLLVPGTADPLMPFEGGELPHGEGGEVLSAAGTAALWAERLGCGADSIVDRLPDADPADGTRVVRERYACPAGRVEQYVVEGGGHAWPGARSVARRLLGRTSQDIDATDLIFRVFGESLR